MSYLKETAQRSGFAPLSTRFLYPALAARIEAGCTRAPADHVYLSRDIWNQGDHFYFKSSCEARARLSVGMPHCF
jgi:hypothetical protein